MTFSVECVHCQADFELELDELLRDPRVLKCPNCGAKADRKVVEAAATDFDDALAQLARLKHKFRFELHLESEELEDDTEDEYDGGDEEGSLWSEVEDDEDDDEEEE